MEKLFELLENMSDRIRALETKLAKQETANATNLDDGEKEFDSIKEFEKFIQAKRAAIAKEQKDLESLRSMMM